MTPEQERVIALRILLACMRNVPTLGDVRTMLASAGHPDADPFTVEAIHEFVRGHLARLANYFESRL